MELKPCPFCGGEAKIVYIDIGTTACYVQCKNLCCHQSKVRLLDKAVEAWNERTVSLESVVDVDRLASESSAAMRKVIDFVTEGL